MVPRTSGRRISGNSRSGTERSRYPVAGCPATSTPKPRNCCISRHTSERLEEISWAILVPLTTTVACSISRRTMRPSRRSVGWGWCPAGFLAREGRFRIVPVLGMRMIMRELRPNNNRSLGWDNSYAHICGLGRVRQQTHRDEVNAGFGVSANILQANSAGTFHGYVAAVLLELGLRAANDGAAHILDRHIVQQNGFAAVSQCHFQFLERTHFHFDDLRATAVAHGAL